MALHFDYSKVKDKEEVCFQYGPCGNCGGYRKKYEIGMPVEHDGHQGQRVNFIRKDEEIPEGWSIVREFTCRDCEDEPDAENVKQMHPTLHSLIWATIGVDLPGIRHEEDVNEFQWRLVALSHIGKGIITRYDPETRGPLDYIPSRDELRRYIGLSTNVSPMTRKQWLKKLGELIERDVRRAVTLRRDQEVAEAMIV